MENKTNYVGILIDTLQKQVDVLEQLRTITAEQADLAQNEEFDEGMLEDSVDRKEVLIARLNQLDEGFSSVYDRVRGEVKGNTELYKEELTQMQELIRKCTDISNEIKVMEQRNRERFAQRFANKQKEYGTARTAASVASNYHKMMNNTKIMDAIFYDKKN